MVCWIRDKWPHPISPGDSDRMFLSWKLRTMFSQPKARCRSTRKCPVDCRGFGTKLSLSKTRLSHVTPLGGAVLPHSYFTANKCHNFKDFGALLVPDDYVYTAPWMNYQKFREHSSVDSRKSKWDTGGWTSPIWPTTESLLTCHDSLAYRSASKNF